MKRINLHYVYSLAAALEPLRVRRSQNEQLNLATLYPELSYARTMLHWFTAQLGGSIGVSMRPAENILKELDGLLAPADLAHGAWAEASGNPIDPARLNALAFWIERLGTVFSEEAALLDAYLVDHHGPFDTRRMVSGLEATLSRDVREVLPEQAVSDYREAGRCLAFGVYTASGFHVLRALETVVVNYLFAKTGTRFDERFRGWGIYAEKLEKAGAHPGLVGLIRQIKNDHRNPLMHPDDFLNEEQAVVLFGISTSAIISFVRAQLGLPGHGSSASSATGSSDAS